MMNREVWREKTDRHTDTRVVSVCLSVLPSDSVSVFGENIGVLVGAPIGV